jgi:hypothetical protein
MGFLLVGLGLSIFAQGAVPAKSFQWVRLSPDSRLQYAYIIEPGVGNSDTRLVQEIYDQGVKTRSELRVATEVYAELLEVYGKKEFPGYPFKNSRNCARAVRSEVTSISGIPAVCGDDPGAQALARLSAALQSLFSAEN